MSNTQQREGNIPDAKHQPPRTPRSSFMYLYCTLNLHFFFLWCNSPTRAKAATFSKRIDHTEWHTTVDITPLDRWWAWHRYLYLTIHNTHKRQTYMPLLGYEPAIPASERILTVSRYKYSSRMTHPASFESFSTIFRDIFLVETRQTMYV